MGRLVLVKDPCDLVTGIHSESDLDSSSMSQLVASPPSQVSSAMIANVGDPVQPQSSRFVGFPSSSPGHLSNPLRESSNGLATKTKAPATTDKPATTRSKCGVVAVMC